MRAFLIVVVSVLLATAGVQVAAQAPLRSPSTTVEGTVRDSETGASIEGAVITAEGATGRLQGVTDEAGRYRIVAWPAGTLLVTVERLGYVTLREDSVKIGSSLRLDFALTPRPITLEPLTVLGWSGHVTPAQMLEEGPATSAASRQVASLTLERDRTMPFAPVLLARAGGTRPGGEQPTPPGGGSVYAMGVRGSLTRQGLTLLDDAPAQQATPASFLVDPFGSDDQTVRVWDAGAPARITGGLEYVMDAREDLDLSASDWTASADFDLVHSAARASAAGRRTAVAFDGSTTLPWTSDVLGEPGHRSRAASVHGWLAPSSRQRVVASVFTHDESMPSGGLPEAGVARLRESTASLQWEADLGEGVLTGHVGAGWAGSYLPPTDPAGTAPGLSLRERRTYAGVEYRAVVWPSVVVSAGGDRLGQRWNGAGTARAAAWGLYGELAWAPDPRVGIRLGARLEHATVRHGSEAAPRAELVWAPAHGMHVTVGSGVHHQLLLADDPNRLADEAPRPVLARGVHHRVTATFDIGSVNTRVDSYVKELTRVPGVEGPVEVVGGGVGAEAPLARGGRMGLALNVERRSEEGTSVWSRIVLANVVLPLPAGLRTRLSVGASRSPGGLVLAGVVDTTGALAGGPTTVSDPAKWPWSVRLDAEVSRTFWSSARSPDLRVYVRLLNAFGNELRPIFLVGGTRDTGMPSVLLLGVGLDFGDSRLRTGPLGGY